MESSADIVAGNSCPKSQMTWLCGSKASIKQITKRCTPSPRSAVLICVESRLGLGDRKRSAFRKENARCNVKYGFATLQDLVGFVDHRSIRLLSWGDYHSNWPNPSSRPHFFQPGPIRSLRTNHERKRVHILDGNRWLGDDGRRIRQSLRSCDSRRYYYRRCPTQ